MTVYILLPVFILFASGICSYRIRISNNLSVEGGKVYIVAVFIAFTLLMALRGVNVGVDVAQYSRIYRVISHSRSLSDALRQAPLTAPVYVVMCWVLSHISKNPQVLIVFEALFVNIGLFQFIKKASPDYVVSSHCWIGLTMLYASMNGNRQFMGVVLVLNAYWYLSRNLLDKKGWILIVAAIGIHTTSIFGAFTIAGFFLAEKVKSYKRIALISLLFAVVFSFSFSSLVPYAFRLVPRYSIYSAGGISGYDILRGRGGGRIVFLYIFLLGIVFLWYIATKGKPFRRTDFDAMVFPAVIFGMVFGIFNAKNQLVTRMLWFYTPLFICFIPATMKKYKKDKGVLYNIMEYAIVLLLYVYSVVSLMENQNGVVPYVFFWN